MTVYPKHKFIDIQHHNKQNKQHTTLCMEEILYRFFASHDNK